MTNIYFIRHAQPNYDNHDDLVRELSEKGLADRSLVTKFLADKRIDAVFSSPFKRAYDTVLPFAESQGLTVRVVEDFRERRIDSDWIDDFDSFCERQWADFSYKLTDGECLEEVQKRNINALKAVLKEYSGRNVAIGSHGTALSTIINYYDKSFGCEDFKRIRRLTPWAVHFIFDGEECIGIEQIDLFEIA